MTSPVGYFSFDIEILARDLNEAESTYMAELGRMLGVGRREYETTLKVEVSPREWIRSPHGPGQVAQWAFRFHGKAWLLDADRSKG